MQRQTPWIKPQTGLTSDFLRPKNIPQGNQGSKKGKNKPSTPEVPKSPEVKRLEDLIRNCTAAAATSGLEKSKKGGCFCLARSHPLSTYTPLCSSCGLILCDVNQPFHACPHCSKALLTPVDLRGIIVQLEAELAETIAKEEDERERIAREARQAAGAFPSLPGQQTPFSSRPGPQPHHQTQPQTTYTHKVLSLTKKTPGKRSQVVVSSYSSTPSTSQPPSRDDTTEPQEPERVPPPLGIEALHAKVQPLKDRPFENLLPQGPGGVVYVPTTRATDAGAGSGGNGSGGSRGKGKRKEKEKGKGSEKPVEKENANANAAG